MTPERTRAHIVQFDGLRGCAVILVLVEHFTFNEWIRGWSPGSVGVRGFFVLSGLLITGILLDDRDRYSAGAVARRFFRNRALRLLPPFGVAVVLAALAGVAGMRSDWLWHAAYLSNVQIYLAGQWTGAGHFWTLAVEQQFYVLWFPVVVLLPRRWLLPVVVALLVGAPLFRMAIVAGWSEFLNVLIPAQADALATGALIALLLRLARGREVLALLGRQGVMIVLGLAVVMLSAPLPFVKPALLVWVVQPTIVAAAVASLICAVLTGQGRLGWLASPALTGLGRISYGLYIFHYFVPQVLNLYVPAVAGLDAGPEKLLRVVVWAGLSVLLAVASWHLIEKPALRLKASHAGHSGRVPDRIAKHDEKPA